MRDNGVRLYQLINGRFSKISHSINPLDGMTFYCDGFEQVGSHWNPGCTEQPYKGKTCIRFSDWTSWEIFHLFENEDWIDFSPAEAEGYVLEFAIKTDDPDLVVSFNFETLLQTDPWYFPTYFYEYRANEHNCQGQWEVVRIPLSNFQLGEDWKDGYYWNKIKNFYISPANYAGKEFYLDEIRLRKVLQ